MPPSIEDNDNAPYSRHLAEELAKLLRTADPGADAKIYVPRIAKAARDYLFLKEFEGEISRGRAAKRKALKEAANAADRLANTLNLLEISSAKLLERYSRLPMDLPNTITASRELANAAKTTLERIPERGGEPRFARAWFCYDLTKIWHEAIGRKPGRRVRKVSVDEHGPLQSEEYGPLQDLVIAALEPIDPEAKTGVEHDIRWAIAHYGKTSGSIPRQ